MAGFCVYPDPYPDSAGVYIASTITEDACSGDEMTDTDGDGLPDLCETSLADAFRPVLYYDSHDLWMDRDPQYAAKPLGYDAAGILRVRILYMPAYWADGGTTLCGEFDLPASWFCGHYGDSEAIILDVHYNPGTSHWLLDGAHLSEHTGYEDLCTQFGSGSRPYGPCTGPATRAEFLTTISYMNGHDGGAPIVYVSYSKHANYTSHGDCNSFHGPDSFTEICASDTEVQLALGSNFGSSSAHLLDCIHSANPIFAANEECFWTGSTFAGWQGLATTDASYSARFSDWGY